MAAPAIGSPPPGAAADWTIEQRWADYMPEEHSVWDLLFDRQSRLLADHADPAYLAGLALLSADGPGIPDFARLSRRLTDATGWSVVCVPGLVPEPVFFAHLAQRRFVAGRFIRPRTSLDYLEQPDVFHDVFGHVPLLADPVFAAFLQAYGARASANPAIVGRMARLYWHTIEFGLVRVAGALRLFGAGIVSSAGECRHALAGAAPRIAFDLPRVLRTDYRTDSLQPAYFVLDGYDALLERTLGTDFAALAAELDRLPDLAPGAVLPGERLYPPPLALAA